MKHSETETTINLSLPPDFADQSKVWIFQSNRPFSEKEEFEITEQLHHFTSQWLTHGQPVHGWAAILFHQFILVMADEATAHVGGCSTDGMMRTIKSLERQYEVQLFDRTALTFLVNGKAQMLPMNQVAYALEKGYIQPDTLLFDNSLHTKAELEQRWLTPLNKSWMAARLGLNS